MDRIIDVFPPSQQEQIRVVLAATLQGVVSQILLPRAEGPGRLAAREVLVVNSAIRALIRESRTHQIYNAIQTGRHEGMCTLEESLFDLATAGLITMDEALGRANKPQELRNLARIE